MSTYVVWVLFVVLAPNYGSTNAVAVSVIDNMPTSEVCKAVAAEVAASSRYVQSTRCIQVTKVKP
jgi:hypothetical protein